MSGTGDYLDRIVPRVISRLEGRRARRSLEELKATKALGERPSFSKAVGAAGVSIIAEVKRASPSKGPIRPDLEVGPLVAEYEAAGARAVSVLTEEDFFLGSLDDLGVAAASTSLPLLRKDFVVDEYQLYEAKIYGASAVLLIAALLDDKRLRLLTRSADELGLDVLLEVHDAVEMERALAIEKAVLGVNNRDLRTFEVSLKTTEKLASMVPSERLLVSESGIQSRADVERLALAGVDAVLVGESLLRGEDPKAAVQGLLDSSANRADARL